MKDNLASINKLKADIKRMKLPSIFLIPEKRKQLKNLEDKLSYMEEQFNFFMSNFSDSGWCIYDSISMTLIETANNVLKKEGMENAERVLLNYFKNDIKHSIHRIKNKSNEFMLRYELINNTFKDHFEGKYYSSVPLFLIIIDGVVNDFTKSKGFFAEGTDVTAWDCLVGCNESLSKMKKIFNKGRNKTNTDEISIPYRNGILHGRDLNYANEHVSCKCVAMLFALADWISFKNSEDKRKEKFEKEMNPPSLTESLQKHKQNQIDAEEIKTWEARNIIVGETISSNGSPKDYINYPYLQPIFDLFEAWKTENYGKLSKILKKLFSYESSASKKAGECRILFQSRKFTSFEFKEIEERGCSISRILVQANWIIGDRQFSEPLEFGCIYQNSSGDTVFPWRHEGEWIIMPWNIKGIYRIE